MDKHSSKKRKSEESFSYLSNQYLLELPSFYISGVTAIELLLKNEVSPSFPTASWLERISIGYEELKGGSFNTYIFLKYNINRKILKLTHWKYLGTSNILFHPEQNDLPLVFYDDSIIYPSVEGSITVLQRTSFIQYIVGGKCQKEAPLPTLLLANGDPIDVDIQLATAIIKKKNLCSF